MAAKSLLQSQTWNRYAYLSNNPLNGTDPLGLYMEVCPPDYYGGDCSLPPGDGGVGGGGIGIPCWWCGGGGGGTGGGGGGGGGTGSGGTGGGGQQPINFPNETLGLPNGFPTSPWGVWGAIIPTAQCGDITCAPIGNGYNPGVLTWGAVWGGLETGVSTALSYLLLPVALLLNETGDASPNRIRYPDDLAKNGCRAVRTISYPATGRSYKGGTVFETEYDCPPPLGTYTVQWIVVNGQIAHGPHIRPGAPKGPGF